MVIWHKQNKNMDPSCLVTTVQAAGGGVMVWGMFSCHTLGKHSSNLSIVSDHVHTFMATMYPSSTSSRIMHHATKLKSFKLVS